MSGQLSNAILEELRTRVNSLDCVTLAAKELRTLMLKEIDRAEEQLKDNEATEPMESSLLDAYKELVECVYRDKYHRDLSMEQQKSCQ